MKTEQEIKTLTLEQVREALFSSFGDKLVCELNRPCPHHPDDSDCRDCLMKEFAQKAEG